MEKIRLFDSFAGIGALHKALTQLGVNVELVGMSEVDSDAIISYGSVHGLNLENIPVLTKQKMIEHLERMNVGFDFNTQKNKVAKLKTEKIEKLYKTCIATNNYGDISKINPNELPDFDLFNFSFCCQDISISGCKKGLKDDDGNLTRSGLYVYGINILKVKKPKYVMLENVKNLIGTKFINDFYNIVSELESIGYNCCYPKNDKGNPACLNAKDFGVPQNRERIFVICIRKDVDDGNFEFPKPLNIETKIKDILEPVVDDKYYLNKALNMKMKSKYIQYDNSGKGYESQAARLYYTDSAMGSLPYRNAGDKTQIIEKEKCQLKQESINNVDYVKGLGCIKRIGGLFDTENRKREAGAVFDSNGFSPTLNTMQGGYRQPIINTSTDEFKLRKLTPTECWRLMGFSKEECVKARSVGISDSQLYKQAGNSIVVNVLYHIFKNLFYHGDKS